jgi:hypothetical protein
LTGWPPCKPCATGETSLCYSTLHPTFNFNQLYSMYPTTPQVVIYKNKQQKLQRLSDVAGAPAQIVMGIKT